MMQRRLLIFFLTIMAAALNVSAQEEQAEPGDTPAIEELDIQDPEADIPAAAELESTEAETDSEALDTDGPGLDTFTPSTEISADRSVAFPNDI